MRDRLIELMAEICEINSIDNGEFIETDVNWVDIADHLLANGVTVQEWISADDPPKENGEYFIYTQDGDIGTAYCKYGRWLAGGCVVTHWMPRPQPPKGE